MKVRVLTFAVLSLALAVTSCKKDAKDDDDSNTVDLETRVTAHADDQSRISNELDAVDNDVNTYIEETSAFGREQNVMAPPCNTTVTFDSTQALRRMTITFNGNNCANTHSRTGTIVATIPMQQRWRDSGAVITETINNLRITRLSDNKSISVNGTRTLTNASGGRIPNLYLPGPGHRNSIRHRINGNMTVAFDNNTQRQWSVARQREFTRAPQDSLVITVTGTHTDGQTTGISEWGTNRFGAAFSTQIVEPLKFNQGCGFRLGAGKVQHNVVGANTVVTFGLNAQGNPTGCPGANPYYFKAVWTGANGNTQTVIRPYF
ncbi:hypothetical protein [Flaviaesturariibacter amylovorans]|uniref:Lipoprotein n=1 Tax=Flaviaesturariibacter amylovorans TaxID=1084520 RepID=A0ABP8HGT5_9BACT